MRAIVDRNRFVSAVKLACEGALNTRGGDFPALRSVLLEPRDEHSISLCGTDLEVRVNVAVKGDVDGTGAALLEGRRLLQYSSLLEADSVNIEIEGGAATFRCGTSELRMQSLPVEEYPESATVAGDSISIPLADIERLIEQTAFAVSREPDRFSINSILLACYVIGNVEAVATNGHLLSIAYGKCKTIAEQKLLVPLPAALLVQKAARFSRGSDIEECYRTCDITLDENSIKFELPDVSIIARRAAGAFPDYSRVIPKSHGGSARFNCADALGAFQRLRVIADGEPRPIRLESDGERIRAYAEADSTASCSEQIEAVTGGTPCRFALNGDYLVDVLSAIGDGDVTMQWNGPEDAILFNGGGMVAVVMPLRA